MKQNSSILFHPMLKPLRIRYFRSVLSASVVACALLVGACRGSAAEKPESLASFDPAKGLKPAQRDLTEIFLQLAGSLEFYGSPEAYLRHIAKEHTRIESLYSQKFGKYPNSVRPDYLTNQYIDAL